MTKLRERMVEDMNLAGLSEGTRHVYLRAVTLLAKRHNAPPDRITEEQVRQYLIDLREKEGLALGTFLPRYYGLKFFYVRSLGWDWALFTKKKSVSRVRSGCLVRTAMQSAGAFSIRSGIGGIAFAFH